MSKRKRVVHLHTHSEWSNFDGCGKMEHFMRRAKSDGSPAIAFTEHGTVRQLTKLHADAQEIGIRPLYGVELYLCSDMTTRGISPEAKADLVKSTSRGNLRQAVYEYERDHGLLERFHLTVLAKNNIGLKNLCRVTSLGWLKGYYKRPRVDLDCLEEHSEGLLVLSGCQSGSLGSGLTHGASNIKQSIEIVKRLYHTFGEDFYGEIMPHNMEDQVKVNKAVVEMGKALDVPLVTTQDAHYIEPGDWKFQEAMLCINTRTVLSDPNRFKFDVRDFWLKGRADLEETYRMWHGYLSKDQVNSSLDMTLEIAEKCQAELELDRFKALIPAIEIPSRFNGDEGKYIQHLCLVGWKKRGLDRLVSEEARRRGKTYDEMRRTYIDRLAHELTAFERQNVIRYFLVVWDLYRWARDQDIEVGPGRGSVGGSLAAFLLGITDVDPIRFDLLFERFLNPDRIDMPDIDMDFQDDRRGEVIDRLREVYGEDRTAQIGTNNRLTGKACLKDIARIMGIPLEEVQPVVDSIIQRSSGDERASATIEDSFKEFEVCRRFAEKYPQVIEYAQKLEGQVKALGIHAAGVVVAPEPLIDIVPLETRQGKVCTAVDMYGAGDFGLMKLDVLGLRNLTAMRRCRDAIKERHGVDVDWLEIDLDDQKVLQGFTDHEFKGIFQYDTNSADKICDGVEFTSFDDVAAMVALNRPGTARSGLATEYLKRKKDKSKIKSIHPIVDKICSDTLGVIVYQEHVQRIFTDVAGFNPATADSLRRKIAKKYGDEAIAKERKNFVAGAVERGLDEELAQKMISQITFFGCVSQDTLVSTPGGDIPINRLRCGDEIWSESCGRLVRNRIKAIGSSGRKNCLRLRFAGGRSVVSSRDHWFQTGSGEFKKARDLSVGTRLKSVPTFPFGGTGTSEGAEIYSAGYAAHFSWLISIEEIGQRPVWDLECEREPANYFANGVSSHNSYGFNKSHSVEYGLIAYREMWLKVYYPLEFMWALLCVEPSRDEVISLVRACGRMGIEVRSADINSADPSNWSITGDTIIGALYNIKGVSPAAVQAISEAGPFADFVDFCSRVNRRRCHKGVVNALIRAGAMDNFVPNPRWLHDNLAEVWGAVGKKKGWEEKVWDALEASEGEPQWSPEDADRIAAEVNPLASGADPLEPYIEFVETMRDDWLEIGSPLFWEREGGYLYGRVIEVKYNQVGDFHSGAEPDDAEKLRMGWGRRYANVNVENTKGQNQRVKIDQDVFDDYRHIVDAGAGMIMAAYVVLKKQWKSCKASYAIDLDVLKGKVERGEELNKFELSLYKGWYVGGRRKKPRRAGALFETVAMVTRITNKIDKNGGHMAFFGLLCGDGKHREAICFASSWGDFRDEMEVGGVYRFALKSDNKSLILDSYSGSMTRIVGTGENR